MPDKPSPADPNHRPHKGANAEPQPKQGPQPAYQGAADEHASRTPFDTETDGRNGVDRDGNAEHAHKTKQEPRPPK